MDKRKVAVLDAHRAKRAQLCAIEKRLRRHWTQRGRAVTSRNAQRE
jgi:hypothetical protein